VHKVGSPTGIMTVGIMTVQNIGLVTQTMLI
jgi:hypothetical protein